MDETALIEEAIAEAERDIAEGTELLAGTETSRLHSHKWILGNINPLCPNTAVTEARTQDIPKKGNKEVTAELEQFHRRENFRPVRTDNLSEKQKHESLSLLIFLKEKRDG